MNKYLKRHNKFISNRIVLNCTINRIEYDIKNNVDDYNYKKITTFKYNSIHDKLINEIADRYNDYETNEQKYKYTVKLIKYLLVCIKFNIEIDETIKKCLNSMDFCDEYFLLFNGVESNRVIYKKEQEKLRQKYEKYTTKLTMDR